MSSQYVEPPESDGDKYTKDSIATEKQKSGSPVEYNYNKNDIERETAIPSTQSYVSKQLPPTTEPQYQSPSQHEGTGPVRQYEQPVEYSAPSGYDSTTDNSANQPLYDSNYTTEEQPKYDEQQPYEQYSTQPYDQTYNAGVYDQQQYDQPQYDQQQYDPQQYDTNQQYEQYPTNYDTSYTNQTAYQSEPQQQPIVNQSPLSGYNEPAASSGTVGQEYTGTRIEPKTQTTRQQQPQLLPKQSPQV